MTPGLGLVNTDSDSDSHSDTETPSPSAATPFNDYILASTRRRRQLSQAHEIWDELQDEDRDVSERTALLGKRHRSYGFPPVTEENMA